LTRSCNDNQDIQNGGKRKKKKRHNGQILVPYHPLFRALCVSSPLFLFVSQCTRVGYALSCPSSELELVLFAIIIITINTPFTYYTPSVLIPVLGFLNCAEPSTPSRITDQVAFAVLKIKHSFASINCDSLAPSSITERHLRKKMSMPKISPLPFPSFLLLLSLLNPAFTSAQQTGDVDEERQGQTVVSADGVPFPPSPSPVQTGPKPIIPGWDDSLTISCIIGSISLVVVIPMFIYVWHRRRRLRRARVLPSSLDKVALVNRKGSLASVDGQESPLPWPQKKLERTETQVSFASEVTIMDQITKPQPVFHAM